MSGFSGGCLCGAVRYESAVDPVALVLCHCRDCQRCTGGPFAPVAVVPSETLKVTQGETRSFTVTGEDGGRVFREFCGTCGSPLFSGLEGRRRMVGVKAGSMDDSSKLTPTMHLWTDTAVEWLPIHDELPKSPRNPGKPSRKAVPEQEKKDA